MWCTHTCTPRHEPPLGKSEKRVINSWVNRAARFTSGVGTHDFQWGGGGSFEITKISK